MKTLSLDLRERIVGAYDAQEGTRENIASRFRVSLGMAGALPHLKSYPRWVLPHEKSYRRKRAAWSLPAVSCSHVSSEATMPDGCIAAFWNVVAR